MKFYTTAKLSENMHETPEGFLVCVGVAIARTGEMIYGAGETPLEPGTDGRVIVQRDADEVFRPETLASFEGKPVTIQHPNDFVSPVNWSSLAKGSLQNVRRGKGESENDLIADLLITDSVAIALVKNGLREVSCGYEAEYLQTGEGRGVQKNIIGNHLALVEEGRAGSAYAINDHKGKGSGMKISEKIRAIFAKAQDEALKAAETVDKAMPEEKKEEAKDETMGYDALIKAVKDLDEKFSAFAKPKEEQKDASTEPTQSEPAEIVAKDDADPMEARMAKLEAMVAKLVARESKEDEISVDEAEGEMVGDDDCMDDEAEEGEEEVTDDGEKGVEIWDQTGDAASRIEILAPGKKFTGKTARVEALKAAYTTKDGKEVIEQFTGGNAPDFKNEKFVNTVFVGASEVLKVKRNAELSKTKTTDDFRSNLGVPKGAKTPEEINKINAEFYGKK